MASPAVHDAIAFEVGALLTRLDRIRPFAMQTPMVLAAALSPEAQLAIERYLARGRRKLRGLAHPSCAVFGRRRKDARELQRRFVVLRLVFARAFNQFEMFADALSQRAQHDFGIWIGGLDAVAEDALRLPGKFDDPPPVITYLDRGMGAAIRRARTRLPGGGENPVSLIRLPRERMVGGGVGSSLVHEVGHQAAAILNLIPSLREALAAREVAEPTRAPLWRLWSRWISEIAADFWSAARIGIGATLGLMQVVSLPRAFLFRLHPTDPHPFPWIRVIVSCAIGQTLFPDPQCLPSPGSGPRCTRSAPTRRRRRPIWLPTHRRLPGCLHRTGRRRCAGCRCATRSALATGRPGRCAASGKRGPATRRPSSRPRPRSLWP